MRQPDLFICRLLYAALSIGLCLMLAGCGGGGGGEGGDAKDLAAGQKVFNYVNTQEPNHLDPAIIKDVYEGIVSGLIFDGLVLFGKKNEIIPGLAEKWEVSPDGKTYTFHLRDAKFGNGKPVTSADVRYSFTRILRPETNSDRKWLFDRIVGADAVTSGTTKDLAGLKTPDDRTVVIELMQPHGAFLTMLAMPNGAVIPDGAAGTDTPNKEFDQKPIGSGPWMLDRWDHDQRLVFLPNRHYWGEKPKIDKFIYHIQVDERVQLQQFKAGNIDVYGVSFAVYPQWSKDPEWKDKMVGVQEMNIYYFAFMNNKPKLQDKRVRQALVHGIDSKSIFENLQKGRGQLAHGPVPPGIEGYRDDVSPRDYNPEKAKQLLAEAGVKDLSIDIWIIDDALTVEMAGKVKSDLEKIGVTANVVRRDKASFRQAIYGGEPDMYYYSWWLDYPDIENSLIPSFHSSNIPYGGNAAHYSNPQFDALVMQAKNEPDPKRRIELFQQAEDFIIDECPWVFLYHRKTYYVMQPWIKNYTPAIMYNADRYTDVEIDTSKKRG